MDQLVSRTGIKQAQVVGEESVVRGAIAGQIVLHCLDEILVLSARAVQIAVQRLRLGSVSEVTTKRGLSPRAITSAFSTTRWACDQEAAW